MKVSYYSRRSNVSSSHNAKPLLLALAAITVLLISADAPAPQKPQREQSRQRFTNRQEVLQFLIKLKDRPEKRLLIGQNLGCGGDCVDGYREYVAALSGIVPGRKTVALLGIDYCWNVLDPQDVRDCNRLAIQHWNLGGLVTVSCHVGNPFKTDGDVHDAEFVDLTQLVTPGTPANLLWTAQLDRIADGLAELKQAGVVVLWRPFHEMNGGWFWWCPAKYKGGGWTPKKEFAALWRHMHRHFTEVRGLDNLLWVYSPNAQLDDDVLPTDHYYPGGDVVDIVGYDIYTNDLNRGTLDAHGSYTRLAVLGKPFGITEFGPLDRDGGFDNRTLLNALKKHRPEAVFCLYWSSWTEKPKGIPRLRRQAIIHQQHPVELLTDPWSVTREDLARP